MRRYLSSEQLRDPGRRPRVLHVVEAFGGGVATAVVQYARATPELEHHLLAAVRDGDFLDSGEFGEFSTVTRLPRSPFQAGRVARRLAADLDADLLHAHSSWAGALVRLIFRAKQALPIVYTPHGFSFERRDISLFSRALFRFVERALAVNTSAYAACAPRECELVRALTSRPLVFVPNVAEAALGIEAPKPRRAGEPFAVMFLGRITAARSPDFVIELVRLALAKDSNIRFVWIGGGTPGDVDRFERNGISVTGWLPHKEALAELRKADLYVHPAAWDGFPLAILEANSLGIPILTTKIAALASCPAEAQFETPFEMAESLTALSVDIAASGDALKTAWDRALAENTAAIQRIRLIDVYRIARLK